MKIARSGRQTDITDAARVFFEPNGVAVVGASRREGSFTANALRYLKRDYAGPIYPVNPKYDEIQGLRCYPSVAAIGENVDLALCAVPSEGVKDVIEDAGKAGVRGMSVFAAGFGESGDDGRQRETEIVQLARQLGVRLIGPNCQGTINFHRGVSASFSRGLEKLFAKPGKIAYLGQSGAIGSSLLNIAQERGVGFSIWASTGNQADLGVADLAQYAIDSSDTSVLMLYIEDVTDGSALLSVFEEAGTAGKRVVLLRSGRTPQGRRASVSHTGAVLGSDYLSFDIAARRAGVTLVDDIDELLDTAAAMAALPLLKGPRLGVITTSGAAGILAADLAPDRRLELAELSAASREKISEQLPGFAATTNPIDVTYQFFARPERFTERRGRESPMAELVATLARTAEVDVVIVVITMVVGDLAHALVEEMGEIIDRSDIPILFVWLGGRELTRRARQAERDHGVLAFASVGQALSVIEGLRTHAYERLDLDAGELPPDGIDRTLVGRAGDLVLPEHEGQEILELAGVPHIGGKMATTPDEASRLARELEWDPLVLKLSSPGVAHRSEIGGVRVGVRPDQVGEVATELLALGSNQIDMGNAVLIQPFGGDGIELLISATWNGPLQPVLMTVGLGGVQAEIHRDFVHEAWPTTPQRLVGIISQLRSAPLLSGYRGNPGIDIEAVADAVWRLGATVMQANGRIREIEVNPLLALPDSEGIVALDVLVLTGDGPSEFGSDP